MFLDGVLGSRIQLQWRCVVQVHTGTGGGANGMRQVVEQRLGKWAVVELAALVGEVGAGVDVYFAAQALPETAKAIVFG